MTDGQTQARQTAADAPLVGGHDPDDNYGRVEADSIRLVTEDAPAPPPAPDSTSDVDRTGLRAAVGWNLARPVGAHVVFWAGDRHGPGRYGRTRGVAWLAGVGQAVVRVTGAASWIALTHVEPVPDHIVAAVAMHGDLDAVHSLSWDGTRWEAEFDTAGTVSGGR